MERIWLKSYPKGVPADVNVNAYRSVPHLFDENINKYRNRPAYICMGKTITFDDVDRLSRGFGAWLQAKGLAKGTRVERKDPCAKRIESVAREDFIRGKNLAQELSERRAGGHQRRRIPLGAAPV